MNRPTTPSPPPATSSAAQPVARSCAARNHVSGMFSWLSTWSTAVPRSPRSRTAASPSPPGSRSSHSPADPRTDIYSSYEFDSCIEMYNSLLGREKFTYPSATTAAAAAASSPFSASFSTASSSSASPSTASSESASFSTAPFSTAPFSSESSSTAPFSAAHFSSASFSTAPFSSESSASAPFSTASFSTASSASAAGEANDSGSSGNSSTPKDRRGNRSSGRAQGVEKRSAGAKRERAPKSGSGRANAKLDQRAVNLMNHWFDTHIECPYPSEEDKRYFVRHGGEITLEQVNRWFNNTRSRTNSTKTKRELQSLRDTVKQLEGLFLIEKSRANSRDVVADVSMQNLTPMPSAAVPMATAAAQQSVAAAGSGVGGPLFQTFQSFGVGPANPTGLPVPAGNMSGFAMPYQPMAFGAPGGAPSFCAGTQQEGSSLGQLFNDSKPQVSNFGSGRFEDLNSFEMRATDFNIGDSGHQTFPTLSHANGPLSYSTQSQSFPQFTLPSPPVALPTPVPLEQNYWCSANAALERTAGGGPAAGQMDAMLMPGDELLSTRNCFLSPPSGGSALTASSSYGSGQPVPTVPSLLPMQPQPPVSNGMMAFDGPQMFSNDQLLGSDSLF